jgi:hypothetical protein
MIKPENDLPLKYFLKDLTKRIEQSYNNNYMPLPNGTYTISHTVENKQIEIIINIKTI